MEYLSSPTTDAEKTIAQAVEDVLDEIDPTESLYPRDMVYYQPDIDGYVIAEIRFERFPEIPATEFGSGKSSLQMKEEIERELIEKLSDFHLDRKNNLTFEVMPE